MYLTRLLPDLIRRAMTLIMAHKLNPNKFAIKNRTLISQRLIFFRYKIFPKQMIFIVSRSLISIEDIALEFRGHY